MKITDSGSMSNQEILERLYRSAALYCITKMEHDEDMESNDTLQGLMSEVRELFQLLIISN